MIQSLLGQGTKLSFDANDFSDLRQDNIFYNNNENDQVKIFELQRVTNNDQTPAIKYLGVYFDSNLNFKYHISQVLKKTLICSLLPLLCQEHFLSTVS